MQGDTLTFETADGLQLIMPSEVYSYEIFPGNFGIPPTNFITRQGYKQHGVTEIDYILGVRNFDIEFWRAPACSRSEYWQNRSEVIEFFRPNRGGQLTFSVNQADGTRRALKCRAAPGIQFSESRENDWNIREQLSFTAFDPIWFDPTENVLAVSSSISNDLVFPITFPIQFGASGVQFVQAVTYAGTWPSFPTLTLTGPYTSAIIINQVTGYTIYFTVPILDGETRTLDLTPGAQSLVDQNGDDAFGDLGPLSNLVNFNLRPDPEAAGGTQTIQAILYGATGASGFTLSYFDRYIGI